MSGSTFDTTKTPLQDLLKAIHSGKMQLPDFQRGWVWDDGRIRSLLASIAVSFPIGAVMLLETGGDGVTFKPRAVEGTKIAPDKKPEILILDGQQRFTSLYQALMLQTPVQTTTEQKKKIERYYYFNMVEMVSGDFDEETAILSIPADKQIKSDFGRKIDLDVSTPALEYQNDLFPVNRVFDSIDWRTSYQDYWQYAPEKIRLVNEFERQVIKRFEQYHLPVIELDKSTPKEAVCLVFEKVNTGGVPLTVFELLTATFAAENFQLRDDWQAREKRLKSQYKALGSIQSDDFLQAIALLVTMARRQRAIEAGIAGDRIPGIGCKRRDILRLTLDEYKQRADVVEQGFVSAARFLHSQNMYRAVDVPYRTQLVPLATVFVTLGKEAETVGAQKRIARWYWCGVLGELYGGAVETRFTRDLPELVDYVRRSDTEPKTVQDANFDANRLLSLRTRNSAAYKGIHALLMRSGCRDFRTGDTVTLQTSFEDNIDIHHIFPQKWCSDAGIDEARCDSIINKTAISARTNRIIGGQAPSTYLSRIETEASLSQSELSSILATHGIAPNLLYSDSFHEFFADRGRALVKLIEDAMGKTVARAGADFLSHVDEEEYEAEPQEWADDGTWESVIEPVIEVDSPPKTNGNGSTPVAAPQAGDLQKRFHEAMLGVYKSAKREINYTATYFLQMVSEVGGLEAARRLLAKSDLSDGFTELYLNDRLDLTVEAQVVKPEYRTLFNDEELAIAEKRLAELGYVLER
jgi:hypothetical protein